jgi:hypothetical protein
MSIQFRSGAEMFDWKKIKQLQMKLANTAAIETKLLSALDRRKNTVIVVAEARGESNAYHGSMLFTSV